jgi:DNA polymerase-3 subunit epsilon
MAIPPSDRKQSTGLKLVRPIAVIDLETTGTWVEVDRIVEIGILKITPDGDMVRFRQRVNPEIRIPKEATDVHGITNEDVQNQPPFKAVAGDVLEMMRNSDLAGYNLKSFDLPVLHAELKRAGHDFSYEDRLIVDVKEIYHLYEQRTLSDAMKFYCGLTHEGAHSPLEDALATWRVLEAQVAKYGLPRSVPELTELLDEARPRKFLDSGRWFSERDGKVVFARGKYLGQLLSKIIHEDSAYVDWMLGLDNLPKDTDRMIRAEL